ncbi:hypothetical protein BUALT_Bualt18G0067200 [Buddleja alternifolia]|uniref:Uncharacterized protein n=1 Tax=Buddleja alternifolia TaxID=168488 RepID=A0AAV6W959_9LAMI|nr:hypothetical protein BUALT_Bualt18G0067200 [Buddleja alternifolia]
MNQINQGESSGGPSVYPAKRRRGRPRKDPSLKRTGPTHVPPGFEGPKENTPQRSDRTDAPESMVGQAVTGIVESTFDAGYLLSVKIGNSTTKLRGVVFKPGHYVPVTAENDVAPHVPMIRRNAIPIPAENQNWSGPGKLAIQTAPPKRKYSSSRNVAPSVPPVGVRGNVVPVVLQPVNFPNGSPNSTQTPPSGPQTAHVMNFGDKDVHMVEPLSMLPPDRSIPVSQIFTGPQLDSSNQVFQGGNQNENSPLSEGTSVIGQGEKVEPIKSTNVDNSSETSDIPIENGKEALKSSAEEYGNTTKEPSSAEPTQFASVTKPLFSYGTGRMTELLQAVQENMKENLVQIAEQPNSASKVEFHETRTTETDPRNAANVP